jgi:hypothetical protein
MAGMQWKATKVLEELRLFFNDCNPYCNKTASQYTTERPKDLSPGSLKLLQLHDCDSSGEFVNGLRSGPVNIETLLFSVLDHQLTDKEEEALVDIVRSAHNLSTLSPTYTPPPFVPTSPPKPEFWIKTSDDDKVDIDDAHANQNSGRKMWHETSSCRRRIQARPAIDKEGEI